MPVAKLVQVVTGGPATVNGPLQKPKPGTQEVVVVELYQVYGAVPLETVMFPFDSAQAFNVTIVQGLTVICICPVPQAKV